MEYQQQTALACRCRLNFSAGAVGVIEKLGVSPPYGLSSEPRIDVLVSQQIVRFSLLGANGEPDWTMVRRGESRAVCMWDHQLRAYWELSEAEINPVVITPAASLEMRARKTEKGAIAELECRDRDLGDVRIELVFVDKPELQQHARALLWLLFGGRSCHEKSGLPLAELEELGCLTRARTIVGNAVSELVIEESRIADVCDEDFRPPEGFAPYKGDKTTDEGLAQPGDREGSQVIPPQPFAEAPVAQRFALRSEEALTPDCLGTTRQGQMTFLFHQDALDHSSSLINQVAPFLGTATIGGGVLTIPWAATMSSLAAPVMMPPAPPGAGLATLLHVPRVVLPPSGGNGLFDAHSVRMIADGEGVGNSFLQREAATGALLNTMRSWTSPLFPPLPTSTIAALFSSGGDLRPLTTAQRVAIADAHEFGGIGTIRLLGMPAESEEVMVPAVATGRFLGVTGTIAFGALTGPLISQATIGSTGEILLGVTLPPVTLTASAVWRIDPLLIATSYAVTVLGCIFMPLSCAILATFATILTTFIFNQLTTLTASTSGVSFTFEIRFSWDQGRGVLTPAVNSFSTGFISVIPTYRPVPNLIRLSIESMITAAGNTMNLWLPIAAVAIAKAIEESLKNLGCEFPPGIPRSNPNVSDLGPRAVSGSVASVAGSLLLLEVELPAGREGAGPFATQAADADTIKGNLQRCHGAMRSDLGRAPGSIIPPAGVYAGMGLNQNALNHYVFARWRQGDYNIDITNASVLAQLQLLAPPTAFALTRLHAWPASCPKVEIVETLLTNNGPGLLAFFDDWRICFEGPRVPGDGERPPAPLQEISFNCKTLATTTVDFPFVPQVLFDLTALTASDERAWQFLDPNIPVGAKFDPKLWRVFVFGIARRALARFDVTRLIAPAAPVRNWRRPIPNGQQQVFIPDTLYMELLARQRSLYMLPALNGDWLELLDGSGAPFLASLLNTTAAPVTSVTLAGLTPTQGATLRPILTGGLGRFSIPP